jgi:hypothetical protein
MARVNLHASAELIDIRLLRCFDALRADRSVSLRRMCFPSGRFAWSYRSRQAVRSTPLRARLRSTGHRSSINRSSSTIAAALPERSARSSSLAAPDGYTLLYGNAGPLSIGPNLQDKVPYDIFKDFASVSLVVTSLFLISRRRRYRRTFTSSLPTRRRVRDSSITHRAAWGSGLHLVGELFNSVAGIDIVHVRFGTS